MSTQTQQFSEGRPSLLPARFQGVGMILVAVLVVSAMALERVKPAGPRGGPVRIEAALSRATEFLAAHQSPDGAWRSDVYGPFKEGDALTPLELGALWDASSERAARERATDYLVGMVQPDGTIEPPRYGITYSVYTAAGAVLALAHETDARGRAAREAWLKYLGERQLTESLGWQADDPQYGGWAYGEDIPRKPAAGKVLGPLSEPNLSSTVFALEALRAAGVSADDPRLQKALAFIERCQNFAVASDEHDEDLAYANLLCTPPSVYARRFDDGGFFFIQGDAVRNKAGVVGSDSAGRERYASYGSATADGLRALLLCGLPKDAPRVVAARDWLVSHFVADTHPGEYPAAREGARMAVYFYYCHSLALAFRAADVVEVPHDGQKISWAEALADELMKRQRPDGSWQNAAVDVREDDPLVATPLAASALAVCRRAIEAGDAD